MGKINFYEETFQIDGTRTNEGAEKKHKTTNSFHGLIYFTFCKLISSIFEHDGDAMSNEQEATVADEVAWDWRVETVFVV